MLHFSSSPQVNKTSEAVSVFYQICGALAVAEEVSGGGGVYGGFGEVHGLGGRECVLHALCG